LLTNKSNHSGGNVADESLNLADAAKCYGRNLPVKNPLAINLMDVFECILTCDPTGFGEGQRFIGQLFVTTEPAATRRSRLLCLD
jgi:hypothetical protein